MSQGFLFTQVICIVSFLKLLGGQILLFEHLYKDRAKVMLVISHAEESIQFGSTSQIISLARTETGKTVNWHLLK